MSLIKYESFIMPCKHKFILGCAQLGMNYGINNSIGRPDLIEVEKMFTLLKADGYLCVDTADAYGESQEVMSRFLSNNYKVNSKFIFENQENSIRKVLLKTLGQLRQDKLHTYSFHRFSDFKSYTNYGEIEKLKSDGLIEKIGVSIYEDDEFSEAISTPWVDTIQIPLNVFDRSSRKMELLKKAKTNEKTIHVRSVYLQGLFFKSVESLSGNLIQLKEPLLNFQKIVQDSRLTTSQLALQFIFDQEEIDGIVVGADNFNHLQENINLFKKIQNSQLEKNVLEQILSIPIPNPSLLNPGRWK